MSHFDSAIGEVARNLETLEQQLEAGKVEWVAILKKFLPDWFRNEGRDAVTENPDAAAALGQERISALKREVEELATNAPSLVDELIASGPWPHTVKDDNGDPVSASVIWPARRGSFQPELGLRKLMWKIYPVLEKYGLGNKGLIQAGKQRGEYPYALPDQDATVAISARYVDLFGKRYLLSQKLRQLKLDQRKSEVAKQWDDA